MICRTCRPRRWCRRATSNEHLTHAGCSTASRPSPRNDARITDLTLDSREVRAGSLFFALQGRTTHGLKFAARGRGARRDRGAVGARRRCVSRRPAADSVRAPRADFEARWWAASPTASSIGPRRSCASRGITGTNGKTTCAYLLAQCLDAPRLEGCLYRHDRLGPNRRARAAHATPRPMPSACIACSRPCAPRACATSRWKSPRMRSIRTASTACASIRPRSPI